MGWREEMIARYARDVEDLRVSIELMKEGNSSFAATRTGDG
jgi:hypothetical protein